MVLQCMASVISFILCSLREKRDRDTERREHEEKLRGLERQLQEVNGRLSTGREFQRSLEIASGQLQEKKFSLR